MTKTRKKRISLRRIASVLGTVALAVLLLFSLAALLVALTCRADGRQPMPFGYGWFVVVTDSMTPELEADDMVFVRRVAESEIAVGDDIVFYSEDPAWSSVRRVHRVTEIRDGRIYTRGIKQGAPDDGPVATVVGKVVGKSRLLGRAFAPFVKSPGLAYAAVAVFAGVMVVIQLVNTVSAAKAMIEEKRNDEIDELRALARAEAERAAPSREYLCEEIDFDTSALNESNEE